MNKELEQARTEEIVKRIQNGETELFGVVMKRFNTKMRTYAFKFLFRGDDIDDVVQQTFVNIYKSIKTFNPERNFNAWIYRIARNEFINEIRDRQRKQAYSLEDAGIKFPEPTSIQTPDFEADIMEKKLILWKLLGTLHWKNLKVMEMYYFDGLTYKEISLYLCLPVSTIGMRISRARQILKTKELERALFV